MRVGTVKVCQPPITHRATPHYPSYYPSPQQKRGISTRMGCVLPDRVPAGRGGVSRGGWRAAQNLNTGTGGDIFRVGISLVTPAHRTYAPCPMVRTCRCAGEIELTPIGVALNRRPHATWTRVAKTQKKRRAWVIFLISSGPPRVLSQRGHVGGAPHVRGGKRNRIEPPMGSN